MKSSQNQIDEQRQMIISSNGKKRNKNERGRQLVTEKEEISKENKREKKTEISERILKPG